MAQIKISALSALAAASITATDVFPLVDDMSGTPTTYRVTLGDLRTKLFAGGGAFAADPLSAAATTITSASANALAVGLNGTTNPVLQVDASTASSATGIKVKSAAAAGGVALSVISSGTNENLTIDAKGSGTITLGGTSTGAITLTRATTLSAALTYGGVTLSNAVTGTGNMVLSASPTLTGTATVASLTLSGTLTLTGATVAGAPTWNSAQAITLSTASQPNVTSLGTLTSLTVSGDASVATTKKLGLNDGFTSYFIETGGAVDMYSQGVRFLRSTGAVTTVSQSVILGDSGASVGFFGGGGASLQAVSGSRGGNAALASLLTALTNHNLITNSTTA